jgi:hypothetical protein
MAGRDIVAFVSGTGDLTHRGVIADGKDNGSANQKI